MTAAALSSRLTNEHWRGLLQPFPQLLIRFKLADFDPVNGRLPLPQPAQVAEGRAGLLFFVSPKVPIFLVRRPLGDARQMRVAQDTIQNVVVSGHGSSPVARAASGRRRAGGTRASARRYSAAE